MAFNPYYSVAKRVMRLRKRPIITERLGAMWKLYPSDWIDNRLLIGRPFERAQLAFAETCIKDRDIDVFYDCGSNIGLYSVILGRRSPSLSRIHCFEPVKSTWSRLKTNLELNDLLDVATPHNYGLGSKPAKASIVIDERSTGTATLDPAAAANPRRNFTEEEDIEIKVFDAEFSGKGQKAFFKIDVEGYEIDALNGMKTYLSNNDCILQIEAWADNQERLKAHMANLGYEQFQKIDPDLYFKKAD